MDKIILTPLRQIHTPKGDVFHGMKKSDVGYDGFGEAYFSTVNKGQIKGWKKHTKMTLNIVVISGEIEFVIYDDSTEEFKNVKLSLNNYQRLTVKPGVWMAFKGLENNSILLNIASIEHNPEESENVSIEKINYEW